MRNPFKTLFFKETPTVSKELETRDFYGGFNNYTPMSNNNPTVANNPTVEECVSRISTTVASLPLHVHVHTKQGVKEAWNHSMSRVLRRPNNEETYTVFFSTISRQLLLYSNCYLRVFRDGDEVVALKIIDAKNVRVERDAFGNKLFHINGMSSTLTSNDVLHIINPQHGYNGSVGVGFLTAHNDLIKTNNALRDYLSSCATSGCKDKPMLVPNSEYWDGLKTEEQQKKMLQTAVAWYQNNMKGKMDSPSDVAIAPLHMDVKTLSIPNVSETMAMEQLQKSDKEIMNLFQCPPELFEPNTKGVYNTLAMKEAEFIYNAVKPICDVICESMELLLPYPYFLQWDFEALVETDRERLMNTLAVGVNNGLISVNEGRERLHLEPMEGFDKLILPLNKGILSDDGEKKEENAPKNSDGNSVKEESNE